jgi:hypothetical protein
LVSFVNEQNFAAGPATNGLLLLVERKRLLLGDAHLLLEELGREVPMKLSSVIMPTSLSS